ncbi:hypothetical protein ZWY2020_043608 [Hordeum vulgare]|nr:hypothetical protein ZWY2020_043608 [Hordeum vulgare]
MTLPSPPPPGAGRRPHPPSVPPLRRWSRRFAMKSWPPPCRSVPAPPPPRVARCFPLPSVFGRSLCRESSVWLRDRDDLFSRSRSLWDEDDEEALRWAALEKLPTYDCARTTVLAMPEGRSRR